MDAPPQFWERQPVAYRARGKPAFEGDALKGTPVFDENDPFAKQIADKWENGF